MKLYFLLLVCFHGSCHAGYVDWIERFFLGKSYQAHRSYLGQNYDQALDKVEQLLDHNPYNPEQNYNVGTILYKQQKFDDAHQAFLRTIDHADVPKKLQEQAYFNAGNCCYQQKQWQKAVDAYRKVLAMNQDNTSAEHNLQLALYKLQEQAMQDQKKQPEDHQENQQSSSSDDQQDQNQQSKSCDGSDKSKSDQQEGNDDQQKNQSGQQGQEKGHDQKSKQQSFNQGHNEHNDEQGDTNDDAGSDEQKQADRTKKGSEKSDENNMTEEEITEKNEQALQDLSEKIEKAGKQDGQEQQGEQQEASDQADQAMHNNQAAMQDAGQHDENGAQQMAGVYKKPELKNPLQQQYQSKAFDDERLTDYHAQVMKTLEEFEEQIQKHVIKNKVAMQGAGQNGKKGW